MSKAFSHEEVQEEFLEHVRGLVEYWGSNPMVTDVKDKLDGLAFSILSALDGATMDLPAYCLMPVTSKEEIEECKASGKDYYEENTDIAGSLHENFYNNK